MVAGYGTVSTGIIMYKKIDIFLKDLRGNYAYECSTNKSKTCKDAKAKYLALHNYLDAGQVKAIKSMAY
jgi:acyl-CoA-binding protein